MPSRRRAHSPAAAEVINLEGDDEDEDDQRRIAAEIASVVFNAKVAQASTAAKTQKKKVTQKLTDPSKAESKKKADASKVESKKKTEPPKVDSKKKKEDPPKVNSNPELSHKVFRYQRLICGRVIYAQPFNDYLLRRLLQMNNSLVNKAPEAELLKAVKQMKRAMSLYNFTDTKLMVNYVDDADIEPQFWTPLCDGEGPTHKCSLAAHMVDNDHNFCGHCRRNLDTDTADALADWQGSFMHGPRRRAGEELWIGELITFFTLPPFQRYADNLPKFVADITSASVKRSTTSVEGPSIFITDGSTHTRVMWPIFQLVRACELFNSVRHVSEFCSGSAFAPNTEVRQYIIETIAQSGLYTSFMRAYPGFRASEPAEATGSALYLLFNSFTSDTLLKCSFDELWLVLALSTIECTHVRVLAAAVMLECKLLSQRYVCYDANLTGANIAFALWNKEVNRYEEIGVYSGTVEPTSCNGVVSSAREKRFYIRESTAFVKRQETVAQANVDHINGLVANEKSATNKVPVVVPAPVAQTAPAAANAKGSIVVEPFDENGILAQDPEPPQTPPHIRRQKQKEQARAALIAQVQKATTPSTPPAPKRKKWPGKRKNVIDNDDDDEQEVTTDLTSKNDDVGKVATSVTSAAVSGNTNAADTSETPAAKRPRLGPHLGTTSSSTPDAPLPPLPPTTPAPIAEAAPAAPAVAAAPPSMEEDEPQPEFIS